MLTKRGSFNGKSTKTGCMRTKHPADSSAFSLNVKIMVVLSLTKEDNVDWKLLFNENNVHSGEIIKKFCFFLLREINGKGA